MNTISCVYVDTSWPFGVLEDQHVERAQCFENFCPGIPLDFLAFVQIYNAWNCHLYCTPVKFTFSAKAQKVFVLWNWKELPLLSTCQVCANSRCKTRWPTPMGSRKLNDPPLTKGSKPDDPPPLCSSSPTPLAKILFDRSSIRLTVTITKDTHHYAFTKL